MATLRFDNDDVRRACCDTSVMRSRFGDATAWRISHRLQQLEAMTSMDDLSFLPYDHRSVRGGIEITVSGDLVLLVSTTQQGAPAMNHPVITIVGIHVTSATPG